MTDKLTHLVYDASLDNSLWPELILELCDQLRLYHDGRTLGTTTQDLDDLATHFQRAFAISERMVELQERASDMASVLNTFSFGIALLDNAGRVIMANTALDSQLPDLRQTSTTLRLSQTDQTKARPLAQWVERSNTSGQPERLTDTQSTAPLLMLPRKEAQRMGFPTSAAAVLLSVQTDNSTALQDFARSHNLTDRETQMVDHLLRDGDLKTAATAMGVTYETGRSYLKKVFEKSGCSSQTQLIHQIATSPLSIIRASEDDAADRLNLRRICVLPDGRRMEYFCLGPEDGDVVLFFDALSGVTVDVLGFPDHCLSYLNRFNIRLIMPCRPGIFQSQMAQFTSLCDFAPDIEHILAQEDVSRFSVLGTGFGACSALGVTHVLQSRIDKVVLSSPSYALYQHPNWRELDQFYVLSGVLGRHWPGMLRRLIPFLVRSILQNTDRYFDRYCSRTKCQHDIDILSHPLVRRRTAEVLSERTIQGADGIVEENLLNIRGWDFDVAEISTPVEIFHGVQDNVAPMAGGEELADHLPNAQFTALPERGQYHHILNWPALMARATGHDIGPEDAPYSFPLPA